MIAALLYNIHVLKTYINVIPIWCVEMNCQYRNYFVSIITVELSNEENVKFHANSTKIN